MCKYQVLSVKNAPARRVCRQRGSLSRLAKVWHRIANSCTCTYRRLRSKSLSGVLHYFSFSRLVGAVQARIILQDIVDRHRSQSRTNVPVKISRPTILCYNNRRDTVQQLRPKKGGYHSWSLLG
ncbi:hypothetical protein CERSUDRAFT_119063 [Gelatoporia subvermispora B]|uniref:Uncharacterized protein n=1 Tax=Ceriporiopsis subvermispora (strain B) TaxID=914234 RepID=M2R1F2_CERS8|nr:hypothetical protein CERSUDRAFT_119063 [Gelatoporia subvermispora B]